MLSKMINEVEVRVDDITAASHFCGSWWLGV